ncbi:bifunctional folylpolyglutamate synthase/dihydrofolate synthase [Candidatus Liberibacter americanus]|uniref:tetrahydrofolate synthase n=1 Tax=Candidatus Liberibacter americanus str. Sao Paulo TaxID=1261131 RepID=U6B374_9HYPH|nr:folylpolyglutamate synthase/dihydrofolate synthase family protein [Candidatus Liberibacter americanus]AHA27509.1 Folylpolyglutamate synthase [Candidatus Liberibacter americanus str. Sao Paulo]EMS36529.1 FolC bifunctional protein [Candidatus Liberibacter americanus PW_SP]
MFSLQRIRRLLDDLGRPQDNLPPIIHIGGTNGKGSVAAFTQRLLETSGLSVHVHTSPHLIKWNERFRLGSKGDRGKLVADELLVDVFSRVIQKNKDHSITTFELSVAAAIVLFSEHPADVAIIEVGLGGRLDATNIIEKPAVSVISSISLDHERYLGDNVRMIAEEKAEIMKSGSPVLIGHQLYDEVRDILVSKAKEKGCPYRVYGDHFSVFEKDDHLVYQEQFSQINIPKPSLLGMHQYINAAVAIATVNIAGFKLQKDCIKKALQSTEWFGRFQKLQSGPLLMQLPNNSEVWLDGGHNPDAGLVIAKVISKIKGIHEKSLYILVGMRCDKDHAGYLRAFEELSPIVLTVPIMCKEDGSQPTSADPHMLMQEAKKLGLKSFACSSIMDAFIIIKRENTANSSPIIFILGSFYLIGEVLSKNEFEIN